jgi:short-subunit dehydrogenase
MDLKLKDKVAVITGGSVGIGLAVAEGLAQEGVHLALCARDEDRVKARASELGRKYNVKAIGVAADVTQVDDLERFVWMLSSVYDDGVDILINNAGTGSEETIMDADDDRW